MRRRPKLHLAISVATGLDWQQFDCLTSTPLAPTSGETINLRSARHEPDNPFLQKLREALLPTETTVTVQTLIVYYLPWSTQCKLEIRIRESNNVIDWVTDCLKWAGEQSGYRVTLDVRQ